MSTSPGAETIILTVDIKANTERLVELRKELNANTEAQKALAAANKAGNLSGDELAAGQIRLKTAAAALTQETRTLTTANAAQEKANKSGAGSIEQLRAELALGTKAYNALSQSERDNTEAGQKLQANNKAISDSLKRLEGAIGDTRRNVGNYNEGIKDVNVTNGQLVGGLRAAADKGLSPFKDKLEQGTGLLGKFKGGADLVKTGLSSLKGAGEEGAGGFKAVAAGIALTGIGLFIIAISAVVGYFTSTNEGGKILKQGLAGLGAVVTSVANLFTGAGKAGVEAFKSPHEAVKAFMDFLKGQVVNRLAAFGVLLDGIRNRDFKKITDSVIQFQLGITNGTDKMAAFANGIGDAVTNATNLEAQFQALKKSRAGLEADEILEKGRVEELIRLSKDRTQSAGQRLNKLREAGKLEEELSGKSIKQITSELTAIKQRNAAKGLSKTADEIQEERDKQKEYNSTVVERNNTLATIKARQSRFILEERAELAKDQKERVSAAQQAREEAVKALINQNSKALAVVQEGSAAELVLKQRAVELAARLELAGAKKSAQDREAIEIKKRADIAKLADDFNQKAIEDAKKHDAATVAESNREYAEAQKALEDYLNAKRAAVEQDYAAGKFGENQYQKQLNAINKAGNAAALLNADQYKKESGAILKKQADDEIKEANRVKAEKKKIKDTELQITEASLAAGQAASDAVISLFGAESEAGKAALLVKKTLALAEIAINLEKQLSANATYGATLGPYGIAYIVATDALAIAAAVASAAKIAGFKQGGYVSGPGSGTSDSIPARLSNGESVMNANTTAMFAPLLSHLNVLGGGVAFASGGLVPGSPARATALNDGGLMARQLGGAAPAMDYPTLIKAIAEYGDFNVGVKALTKETARYNNPRALSTLG